MSTQKENLIQQIENIKKILDMLKKENRSILEEYSELEAGILKKSGINYENKPQLYLIRNILAVAAENEAEIQKLQLELAENLLAADSSSDSVTIPHADFLDAHVSMRNNHLRLKILKAHADAGINQDKQNERFAEKHLVIEKIIDLFPEIAHSTGILFSATQYDNSPIFSRMASVLHIIANTTNKLYSRLESHGATDHQAPIFLVLLLQAQVTEFLGLKNLEDFSKIYLTALNDLQEKLREILKLVPKDVVHDLQRQYQSSILQLTKHAPTQVVKETGDAISFFTSVSGASPFIKSHEQPANSAHEEAESVISSHFQLHS